MWIASLAALPSLLRLPGRRGHPLLAISSAIALLIAAPAAGRALAQEVDGETCTYTTYRWNVELRRSVDHRLVRHPYSSLSEEEVDPVTGCTVCEEDQRVVDVPPLEPFQLCAKLADRVEEVLARLILAGEPIFSVQGYRVGRSRGVPDASGNRTQFSNHSYGIAIDINPEQNGLYTDCVSFGPDCRLLRGGPWRPSAPGSLTPDGAIVRAFKALGFRWGGEIGGRQKDFMHFSPSGY